VLNLLINHYLLLSWLVSGLIVVFGFISTKKLAYQVESFIPEIDKKVKLPLYQQRPIHPYQQTELLPSFLSGNWNKMTQLMFNLESFREAYIYRLEHRRDNACIVEGERGEGKTNVVLFLLRYFNTYFNVPFSVDRNVYLGRDVDLSVNFVGQDFKNYPFSAIAIDEAEIPFSLYRAASIQNREAKIFMDTFRSLKLGIFFVCPDKSILDQRIVDRCNWNIICDWNEIDKEYVEITIEYYGRSKDRTTFEWLQFEEILIPYIDKPIYDILDERKHGELYTTDGLRDYHVTRKGRLDESAEIREIERAMKIQVILDSDVTLNDKVFDLFTIPCKNSEIVSYLKEEKITDYRVKRLRKDWLLSKRDLIPEVS
jgi:hypothetical protein